MHKGDPGGVVCPIGGRDIAFPTLYRVVQSVSPEEAAALGIEPIEGAIYFTIYGEEHAEKVPYTQFRAPVIGLRGYAGQGPGPAPRPLVLHDVGLSAPVALRPGEAGEQRSLIIRWHPSEAHLEGYATATMDLEMADDLEGWHDESCQTADGIFSATWRPTDPTWPAPLVIYLARVSYAEGDPRAEFHDGEADWYAAFAPDDSRVTLPEYEPNMGTPWEGPSPWDDGEEVDG